MVIDLKLKIKKLLKKHITKEYLRTINDPNTKKFIEFSKSKSPKKKEDLINYIKKIPKTDHLYGIFKGDKHVANFKFQKKRKKIYIGFLTFLKYQGTGIFVKIFPEIINKFKLKYKSYKTIYLGVDNNNLRAKSLYYKLGFKKLNTKRGMYLRIKDYKKLNNQKKIIFFGGGDLLIFLVKFLRKKKIDLVVFSEKRHLNQKYQNTNIKNYLKQNGIRFFDYLKNVEKKILKEITPHSIGISNRYSLIFKKQIIEKFKNRLFNIHSQALPNFRGKGGFSWNILSKSNILGSSIHLITEKIDKGKILMMIKSTQSLKNKNYDQIEKKVSLIDKKLIKKFLNHIILNKKFNFHEIDYSQSFYWPALKTSKNAWINFNWQPDDVSKFINAFSGKYGGAFSFYNKNTIRLKNAKNEITRKTFHPYQVGIIFRIVKKRIYIVCGDGAISCEYKLKSGKKVKIGSRLYTTKKKLEQSLINSNLNVF